MTPSIPPMTLAEKHEFLQTQMSLNESSENPVTKTPGSSTRQKDPIKRVRTKSPKPKRMICRTCNGTGVCERLPLKSIEVQTDDIDILTIPHMDAQIRKSLYLQSGDNDKENISIKIERENFTDDNENGGSLKDGKKRIRKRKGNSDCPVVTKLPRLNIKTVLSSAPRVLNLNIEYLVVPSEDQEMAKCFNNQTDDEREKSGQICEGLVKNVNDTVNMNETVVVKQEVQDVEEAEIGQPTDDPQSQVGVEIKKREIIENETIVEFPDLGPEDLLSEKVWHQGKLDLRKWLCPFCETNIPSCNLLIIKNHLSKHLYYDAEEKKIFVNKSSIPEDSAAYHLIRKVALSNTNEGEMSSNIVSNDNEFETLSPRQPDDFTLENQSDISNSNIDFGSETNVSNATLSVLEEDTSDSSINLNKIESLQFTIDESTNRVLSLSGFDRLNDVSVVQLQPEKDNEVSELTEISSNKTAMVSSMRDTTRFKRDSQNLEFTSNFLSAKDFVWSCSICLVNFILQPEIAAHRRTVHADIKTICIDRVLLVKYKNRKPSLKPGFCELCGRMFKSQSILKHHMMLHKNKAAFQCNVCHRNMSSPRNLQHHKKTHSLTDGKKYRKHEDVICEVCGKIFPYKHNLDKHMAKHREDPDAPLEPDTSVTCDICDRVFNSVSGLHLHQSKLHFESKKFKQKLSCEICGMQFSFPLQKKYHMNGHLGLKPYKCRHCTRCFSRPEMKLQHEKTHGEKNITCDVCDKKFVRKAELRIHYRIHTGERPYPCKVCGWRFRQMGDLFKHYHKHTEEEKSTAKFEQTITPEIQKVYEHHIKNKEKKKIIKSKELELQKSIIHVNELEANESLEPLQQEFEIQFHLPSTD